MSDHINVSVRLRPLLEKEILEKHKVKWSVDNNAIYLLDEGKKPQERYIFGKYIVLNTNEMFKNHCDIVQEKLNV